MPLLSRACEQAVFRILQQPVRAWRYREWRSFEAFLAEEYRLGRLNKPDLRRLLSFETSYEIDGFLKAHNVYEDYSLDDFER